MSFSEARSFAFFLLSIIVLFSALMLVAWATSVGNNISVTGTLTVDSNSTFGDAAGDVNLFTGTLQASTTALFTGAITTYGNATFGDTAADIYNFVGGLQASSTLGVTGTTFLFSDLRINGFSTTTSSNGNLRTNGNVGIATTTTMTTNVSLGVHGSGTTTLAVGTDSTTLGSCLQLDGIDGVTYRIFAAATTSVTKQLVVEAGSCNGNQ